VYAAIVALLLGWRAWTAWVARSAGSAKARQRVTS
jgi:hypothetical protein